MPNAPIHEKPPMQTNPVLVEVRRGGRVESIHRGSVVVVSVADSNSNDPNSSGVVFTAGQTERMIYPRSTLKIFQAFPLLESGAAERFDVTPAELALACASHNAEPAHLRALHRWLRRIDLGVDDLECGATPPMSPSAARALTAAGTAPTRAHHNCSGKHVGMLSVAKHLGVATAGYSEYHHPVQRGWMVALSEWLGVDVFSLPWERDGCGLPAVCMTLEQLARAYAGLAAAEHRNSNPNPKSRDKRAATVSRILAALRAHPHMLAGAGRCCTDVNRVSGGRVLIKTGAEGVYAGVVPHLGLGFALKIDDGATRAANVATVALLNKLGALQPPELANLTRHFRPPIINSQGRVTGEIAPASGW